MEMMPTRIKALSEQTHWGLLEDFYTLSKGIRQGLRLGVIGSWRAQQARVAAWYFDVSELHLVDKEVPPDPFEPICHEEFHQLDVTKPEFVTTLAGRVDLLFCHMTVHELTDPLQGLVNMLTVTPKTGGLAWFFDFGPRYFLHPPIDPDTDEHVRQDVANARRHGLDDPSQLFSLYEEARRRTEHRYLELHEAGNTYQRLVYTTYPTKEPA